MAHPNTPDGGPQPVGTVLAGLGERARQVAQLATGQAEIRQAPAPDPAPAEPQRTPLDDELDGWLAADMLGDDGDYREPQGHPEADQLLGVLAFLAHRQLMVDATAAGRIATIQQWKAERTEQLDRERDRIEAKLEGWARAQHEASGGKTVTWKLPSGELRLRPNQRKVHVLDDQGSADLLRRAGHGELLTEHPATWTVSKTNVKKRAGDTLGPVAADALSPEPGYVAHLIPATGDPTTGEFLPGVYLLVPTEARKFTAVPTP